MKSLENLLNDLARLSDSDHTILSAYIDLSNGWKQAERFIEKQKSKLEPLLNEAEQEYFEHSLSFLQGFLAGKKARGFHGPGIAAFADLNADFSIGVELPASPSPLLAVDDEAVILPLALQLDEYQSVGIIMVDASASKIMITAGHITEDLHTMREKIHHRSKVGGWSQMRYQRRRDKQIKHFAKDIVEQAIQEFDEAGIERILMAGRDRMVQAVEDELPQKWQERIIGSVRWDLDGSNDELLAKIKPIMEQAEKDEESNLMERFIGELRRDGLAVIGIEDTAAALEMGAVDILLMGKMLEGDTAEELVSMAKSTAAYVEFVASYNDVLESQGGVGALLRYKVATPSEQP